MSDPKRGDARLERELAELGSEHEPKAGWQARVLAATAPPPRRRAWWWLAAPAIAAAAVVVFVAVRGPRTAGSFRLRVEVASSPVVVRGSTANVGDTVRATASGGRHRAVWIYRGDTELVVACPGAPACSAAAGALSAELTLRTPGRYTIVAIDGESALVAPTGSFDRDVAGAEAARARIEMATLEVR